jgi:2,3-bisphosphoglycerate-dependent phosphoglycerate mutase
VLLLVRHSIPAHGPEIPARDWPLTSEGRAAAAALCARLQGDALLVASTEPKAIQTLESAGSPVTDPRFDEIGRIEAYADDFRTARRAYVEGADHPDWEPREDVVRRFAAGIADHYAGTGRPVVIATHGMAMTLWLTATIGLPDPGGFWAGLTFPDAYVVDLSARSVSRLM